MYNHSVQGFLSSPELLLFTFVYIQGNKSDTIPKDNVLVACRELFMGSSISRVWLLLTGVFGRGGGGNVQSFPEGIGRRTQSRGMRVFSSTGWQNRQICHTGKSVLQISALSLEEVRFSGGDPQELWLCKWHKEMVEMLMSSTPPRSLVTHPELVITSQSTIFTNFLIWCVNTGETDSRRTCLKVTVINNWTVKAALGLFYLKHTFFFNVMERKCFSSYLNMLSDCPTPLMRALGCICGCWKG